MALESATYVSDLTATNPASGDLTSQGDDHLRLLKAVAKATFPNATKAFRFPTCAAVAAGTVNVVFPTDLNKLFPVNATAAGRTVNLPDCTSGGTVNEDGFTIMVIKTDASANAVTIDGSGSQTINGATTLVLSSQFAFAILVWNKLDVTWYAYTATISANQQFTTIELGHASDTTLARDAAGSMTIEGSKVMKASDVVNDLTTGGAAVPASAETVKTLNGSKAASSHTHAQSDVTNLTTDLAAKMTVSTNTGDSDLTFPVGQYLICSIATQPNRNAVITPYLASFSTCCGPTSKGYSTAVNGTALTGTWRTRGVTGTDYLIQRSA